MNQPNFKKVPLEGVKCKLKEQIKVTTKTDVLVENAKNIVSVSCWADVFSVKVAPSRAEYKGKAIFFIAYEDENGEVLKCESASEFDGVLESDGIGENSRVSLNAYAYKTETDVSGIKLNVVGNITLDATVYDLNEYECLESGDDIICDVTENTFLVSLGRKEIIHPLSEEFSLPYKIKEVLSQNAVCIVTNAQCGVNTIIVDGEVYLSAILLQSSEKKDIIKETKVVPFRIEIDCEDAMPSCRAVCSAKVRAFKSDVSVDDEKSTVNCLITLKLSGEAFSENTFNLSHDVFSKTEELEVKKDTFTFRTRLEDRCVRKGVTISVTTEESLDNCQPLGSFFERVDIISKEKNGQNLNVIGVLSANCIIKKEDGRLKTLALDFPIDLTFSAEVDDFDECELFALPNKSSIKVISANQIEITAEIIFMVSPYKSRNINYVKEITSIGEKTVEDCAISVIIPYKGEDLWSLAKRLNQSPDEILLSNKDLTFPLSGEERIIIYRQK